MTGAGVGHDRVLRLLFSVENSVAVVTVVHSDVCVLYTPKTAGVQLLSMVLTFVTSQGLHRIIGRCSWC